MPDPLPCRLSFILARDANLAVIFRRGPSKWVQLIQWDTARDIFVPGQWFHGRLYERRSDLSPDGTKLIYFANKINTHTLEDREYTYAWTAISKPPYLTALALWPKGDCWHGGGLFETDRRVWLNHRPPVAIPHPDHKPQGLKIIDNPHAHGEDDPVFLRRLERDGWKLKQLMKGHWDGGHIITEAPLILAKACPNKPVTLLMRTSIVGGASHHEFVVRFVKKEVAVAGAEWADWDRRGRLVFVRVGKVFTAKIDEVGTIEEKELADFTSSRPENKRSPGWARRW